MTDRIEMAAQLRSLLWLSYLVLLWPDEVNNMQVSNTKMLNQDQEHRVDLGASLELPCEFYMDYFDLFNNPVLWNKIQLGETTPINIMGNILDPFVDTGRFHVKLDSSKPTYRLTLVLEGIAIADYGNYTCEVRGKDTSVLAAVTHTVFVLATVDNVSLSLENDTAYVLGPDDTLTFTEGEPASLWCKSIGGIPPPDIRIYIGQHEITGQFSLEHSSHMTGMRGIRLIEHRSMRWTEMLEVTAAADRQKLQCAATVPGYRSQLTSVNIIVRYAPVVTCEETIAPVGRKDVSIRCMVKSRPGLNVLYWVVDRNGTTLSSGQTTHEYQTLNMDRGEGGIETRLHISEVQPGSYREYTIVAENGIGKTMHTTELLKKSKPPAQQSVLQLKDNEKQERDQSKYFIIPAGPSGAVSLRQHIILEMLCLCLGVIFQYRFTTR